MTRAGYTPPKAEMKKPPKADPPKKKKKKHKRKRGMSGAAVASLVIFVIAAAIGAGTIFVYTQTQPYQHTFVPGTMLMGYPLAGATRADAQALLDTIAKEHVDTWHFEIICMDQTYTLTAKDVQLTVDKNATLNPLWQVGREGGMLARYLEMLRTQKDRLIIQRPALTYDLTAADALLEAIRADVECEPVDAMVTFTPGRAQPFAFTDEEAGYALDLNGILDGIETDILNLASSSITLEPAVIEPQAYRAELESAISLRSHLTVALDGDEASVGNAALAAAQLNGLCIEPGETLSFNEAVGARTQERGYQIAPEPAYGENVSGVGGGVCQASTALYRAALLAGIDVKERSAAARPVAYCPMGQEAAVSDQGLDLVIQNQTDATLFVSARVYEDGETQYLEIMLIGEELGRRYALESLSDETGTIQEPVYVRDREGKYATYTDERVPVSEALPGYAADVERVTLDGEGNEIAREIVSHSEYEAAPPMIYVGMTERE